MRTLHRHLHLQHHRHTGRRLQHKHTSYRSLAFLLFLSGVFMLGLNMMARATADTITSPEANIIVTAAKYAPVPTEAPVITSPADGTVVYKSKILLIGTCPLMDPNVILVILDKGQVTSSVVCDTGSFEIPLILEVGTHVFVARTYTITDGVGPDSAPVTVKYLVDNTSHATDTAGSLLGQENDLQIVIDRPFIVFGPAKDAIWTGQITGGTLPYRVRVDWGDGASQDYHVTKSGDQEFTHHYRSMSPHLITLKVADAHGRGITKSYAAVTPYVPPVTAATLTPPWNGSVPLALYGAYLLLLVVCGGLWAEAHPNTYVLAPAPVVSAKRRVTPKRAGRR